MLKRRDRLGRLAVEVSVVLLSSKVVKREIRQYFWHQHTGGAQKSSFSAVGKKKKKKDISTKLFDVPVRVFLIQQPFLDEIFLQKLDVEAFVAFE